jgi:hypothetical protein
MSEESRKIPLLRDGLSVEKRMHLSQVMSLPGFNVFIELMGAGCTEFNEDVIKTTPETERYAELLPARQQCAYAANLFSKRVLQSAEWHAQQVRGDSEVKVPVEDPIAKRFGIHIVKPK